MSRSLQLGLRTGDLYVSSHPTIQRSCSIQMTKLKVLRGLGKEDPHVGFYLSLQVGSRGAGRGARSDEIIMPQFSDNGESEHKFTNPLNVSFEYNHFTKGRANILYLSLQKRKKYRTRTVPGYKTLARGQISLDDIIQLPPPKHLTVRLFQVEKESKDIKQIEIGSLEISEVNSMPTDDDDSKYVSDSSDDDENISSSDRKLNKTNSVASRMKNAMLTKILAKFIKNNPHINPEDLDLDGQDLNEIDISELQLYDELEDFAISDEDDEIFDDDVSIASTPRPNLKPYFDSSASVSSLQPRNSTENPATSRTGTYTGLASVDEEEKNKKRNDSHDSTEGELISTDEENKKSKKVKRAQKSFETDFGESSLSIESIDLLTKILEMGDEPLLLLIRDDENDEIVSQIEDLTKSLKVVTLDHESIQDAFNIIIKRVQEKSLNIKNMKPIRICTIGTVMNFNAVVKIYIDQISKKSADWANFFCFTFLPLDGTVSKQHVTQRLGELCPVYRNLFLDSNWTSGEGVLSKIERVVQDATKITLIPVAEAMVSFHESRPDGNNQIFVPFCVELFVQETDDDSDSGEEPVKIPVSSPTSSPFINSNPKSLDSEKVTEKLHLAIDYWTEDKSGKQSIKETLRSLEFQPQKNSILMKVQCRPKRNIAHLPGRKRKDNEMNREKREVVTRAICKSKEKSKMAKLTIDGFEYEHISFFQISRSSGSSNSKMLPVALFTKLEE